MRFPAAYVSRQIHLPAQRTAIDAPLCLLVPIAHIGGGPFRVCCPMQPVPDCATLNRCQASSGVDRGGCGLDAAQSSRRFLRFGNCGIIADYVMVSSYYVMAANGGEVCAAHTASQATSLGVQRCNLSRRRSVGLAAPPSAPKALFVLSSRSIMRRSTT